MGQKAPPPVVIPPTRSQTYRSSDAEKAGRTRAFAFIRLRKELKAKGRREYDGLVVSSRPLMEHSYRVIRRMRYGTDSTRERHNDRAAVFRVKRLEGATACDP